ncbi:hypothetical protein TREMEDRAFT_42323 [Tremella mesenterica DSM 1558]|uniref:uncharacterized protein n=1 Tax=Tremella mesenterica (strain ATCC 24925 / CBS 8224 / DSM 1558 / NBRC 9311 / NRRL Y-6157 / RJB 2259-6 / UBC 559-6) TaxID=578456 RepID=UPI0003F4942B|nr:uncharacterized protein TREMEDRAFT_42323 [Tremella mesenterica DSM 1558]EIW73340.1 hypothetical protein TREMEDRAFT_42323 [Tremella mesenterica DSM 1558]
MVNTVSSGKLAPPNGIQSAVRWKLILFAILMAVVPIGTYFSSLRFVFGGATTPSAIAAIVAANMVLVGYVIVAFREEAHSPHPPIPLEKKSR